jgi:hypothetical protein
MDRLLRLLALALLGAALAGCATGFVLDNQVQSYSTLPALPAQATYRFERLPLQQADPNQTTLELLADPALQKAGLRRDDANPKYSVQVAGRAQQVLSPWASPYGWGWGGWGGWGYGWGGRGTAVGLGFAGPWPAWDSYWFHREVSVVVRDLATNQVVYQTSAISDGPWYDNGIVLPAMFDAAMQGFPTPPPSPRKVNIQVGAR